MSARFLHFSGYSDIRHPFQISKWTKWLNGRRLNGRSEHKSLKSIYIHTKKYLYSYEKVLKNRRATDQHRIVLNNKTNTVSKFEENRENPDLKTQSCTPNLWKIHRGEKGFLNFSHRIHNFIINNCLAFSTENLRFIALTKIRRILANLPKHTLII